MKRGIWTATLAGMSLGCAWGQSFNIDLDIFGGSPEIGDGVPSDAFGAAANQAGRWNRISTVGQGPFGLVALDGSPSAATYSYSSNGSFGGGGVGFAFGGNTGDYALLLNDAAIVGPSVMGGHATYTFQGMSAGVYDIYTYAVHMAGASVSVPVRVVGAIEPETQIVTGPMPGNAFEYLVTHSVHRVEVLSGASIVVDIVQPPNLADSFAINGFQIKAVPEPRGLISLLGGIVLLASRRLAKR